MSVDVLPLEGAEFAEAEAGAERDVEEVNVEVVGLVAVERIRRREKWTREESSCLRWEDLR